MFETLEAFPYFECSSCGCVQLTSIPEDMSRYYGNGYYSLTVQDVAASALRKLCASFALGGWPWNRPMRAWLQGNVRHLEALSKAGIRNDTRILDVGCGSGELLFLLRELGYSGEGIDPFLSGKVVDRFGVRVRPIGLEQVEGKWELIMLHHSLEHMADHRRVLGSIRRLLTPDGQCIIRIPIAEEAWRMYGVDWVQLDAPRHLLLHSFKSFQIVAHQSGFSVERAFCDSDGFQFWGSELYKLKIPRLERGPGRFSTLQKLIFMYKAAMLNSRRLGDQAVYFLRPS